MNAQQYSTPEFDLPDRELNFLASENRLYDYKHLYGFSEAFSKTLSRFDISPEKPLVLLSDSSDELLFVIGACFLLNIPILPLNPNATDKELSDLLEQLDPILIFADKKSRKRVEDFPTITVSKSDLNRSAKPNPDLHSVRHPESELGIFLTSGSTGTPKKVILKRRQMLFGAESSAENFRPGHNRYWLLCLPLHHIGGISIILRSILYHSAIYRMDRFDEHQVHTFLSENRLFQAASLVPTMLLKLLDNPLFQTHLDLKAILLGGGPLSLDLINRSIERGVPIVSSYGMTETCAQIAANPLLQPSGVYQPKKSVGRLFRPNEIQIRDPETGAVLQKNESGNIWLKGPQVFDGYGDSDLNSESFDDDGWFNTGDYGRLNRHGLLFIESRRTDRIITGGENVDPTEVEKALNDQKEIVESAVFGITDPKWGQKVVALIVTKKAGANIEKIKSELKKSLQDYKIPKEIRVTDSLPKSSLGKLQRGKLEMIFKKLSRKN